MCAASIHTATLLHNGLVLVTGGQDGNLHSLGSAELYDPATGLWSVTGSMTTNRSLHTATLLANGKVLVAGGLYYDGVTSTFPPNTELYDPSAGKWTKTGAMVVP